MSRLHSIGFGLSFNAMVLWTLGPAAPPVMAGGSAAGEPPGEPPGGVPAIVGNLDETMFIRDLWLDLTGVEFEPGHSGMTLWQELPGDQWLVVVSDTSRERDAGVTQLTYTEEATRSFPAEFVPHAASAELTLGTLTNGWGDAHVALGLRAEVPPPDQDPGQVGHPAHAFARPLVPMARYDDLDSALPILDAVAELFQTVARGQSQSEDGLRQPGHAGDAGHVGHVGHRSQADDLGHRQPPGIGHAPAPGPMTCAAAWALQRRACFQEFKAKMAACFAAIGIGCYAWKCALISAPCTLFGGTIGATACWWICVAACLAIVGGCIATAAYLYSACKYRADAARVMCDPTWTPTVLDYAIGFPPDPGGG